MSQSRELIINAAAGVFSRFGYHAATMDTIAAVAEVAKGTIYYHFSSKADLFKSVVVEGLTELTRLTRKHMSTDQLLPVRLYHVLEAHIALYLDYPDMAKVVFRESAAGLKPEYMEPIRQAKAVHLALLAELLRDGRSNEGPLDYGFAAAGLFSLLDGTCSYYLQNQNRYSRKQLVSSLFQLISTGLCSD